LADGSTIHALINAAPLRNEQGIVYGAVGALIDVTAQKTAEEVLHQDSRRKDDFLATLAHELRNPLAAIQSGLEMIKRASPGQTQLMHTHAIMHRQMAHLTRLIDDLLDVSRISSGKFDLRKETLDARSVIDDVLDVSRAHVESGGHSLEVSLPGSPVFVNCDSVRLAQVVTNLLNNAAKYTPEGGAIALTLEQQGDDVVIRVIDNGIGIESEMLPQLFNIYSQLEKGKERRKGGIGIGLSLAKRIVELHGGTLTAQSAGAGKGSTFTVRLPPSAAVDRRAASPRQADIGASGPKRILIVDDNKDAARMLGALLEQADHTVRIRFGGEDAIRAARTFEPEIAFVDIGLPDMSGYDVVRAMRADPVLRQARLVALTGWGSETDRLASLEAGFDFHVTKPATMKAINAILPDLQIPE
jgi:CheY-like chemotaxis protein